MRVEAFFQNHYDATIGSTEMSTYAEDRVLPPLDPIPEEVNDWPHFGLEEVKIFYQGKGRYADLLEASNETPLCVLGNLMPLDDDQESLGKSA